MKHTNKEGRGPGSRLGYWAAMGVVALVAVLSVSPAQAQIPAVDVGACGPMDVVFIIDTTGSMGDAIDNIKNDLGGAGGIIPTIQTASDNDEQLGLVVVNGSSQRMYDSAQVYDCVVIDPNLPQPPHQFNFVGDCIIVLQEWGIHLTQVTPRCSMRPRGGLPARSARVRGALRHRRGLSRLSGRAALAGRVPLPQLWA